MGIKGRIRDLWTGKMISISTILALVVSSVWATDYTLEFEDSDLYSECSEKLPGAIGLREAFDMRNIVTELDIDGLHLSGNCTTVWDVPSTDRISVGLRSLYQNHIRRPHLRAFHFAAQDDGYAFWPRNLATNCIQHVCSRLLRRDVRQGAILVQVLVEILCQSRRD